MPAKDLGLKYVCFKCGTKFYDLKKPDPVRPKCGADQRESPALKPVSETRRGRLAAAPKVVEPEAPAEPEAAEAEDGEEGEAIEGEEEAEVEADEDI
jgi:uncharacterized protein (TIGR02300 family)